MGEKPLSIDEAPAQARTIGVPGPLGGVDTPPPGMAAGGINTTRSNIKNSGGVAAPPVDGGGGGGADGEPDDALPPGAGAAGIITTRSNIKHAGSVAGGGSGSGGSDTDDRSDPPGLAIKENGIKYGDGGGAPADGTSGASIGPDKPGPTDPGDPFPADPSPGGGAGSIAGGIGEPIPGINFPIKKPSGAAAATGPVMPEPTRPADPFPPDGGPAGIAIKEQGVKYGEDSTAPVDSPEYGVAAAATTTPGTAGNAGDAVDGQNLGLGMETMGAARAGEPIPGIDVKLGKNPGGGGDSGWQPPPDPGPGPSPDRKPIPGIDDAEKKKA